MSAQTLDEGAPVLPPMRLAVIGAGAFASRRHIPDALKHPDIELAAICRRNPEPLAKLARHFGLEKSQTFTDWRRMVRVVDPDAVVISSPNALHYKQAKWCLERGLHVLLEKPMTLKAADARRLLDLAADQGSVLAVALNPPYWAHCHRIRAAIHAGRLGEIEGASIFWSGSVAHVFGRKPPPAAQPGVVPPTLFRADPAQCGGGYFMDGGAHLVSELLWVTGLRAVRVNAIMDALPVDLRAVVSLELENGAVASLTLVGDTESEVRRIRVLFSGSNGTAGIAGPDFDVTLQVTGQEAQRFKEADLAGVPGPVEDFTSAVRHGTPLHAPPEHAAHVTEVLEAAYRSARAGKTLTI